MGKKWRIVLMVLLVAAVLVLVNEVVQYHGGWVRRTQPAIALGANVVVLKRDGSLWAMGPLLGSGIIENHARLYRFSKERDWVAVACGAAHALALKSNGSLWAWGQNDDGQLGIGNTEDKNVPVQVDQDHDWAEVSAGLVRTVALKSDGSLWAWGSNLNGMLGDGVPEGPNGDSNSGNKSAPVRIGTANDWRAICAGHNHSAGIKADGSLWTWGSDYGGALGRTGPGAIPGKVGSATGWKMVGVGASHMVSLKQDGTLWAWGSNWGSQLGDGTVTAKPAPVQIGQATDWVWASGAMNYTVGLKSDGSLWFWGRKLLPFETGNILWLRSTLRKYHIPFDPKPFQSSQVILAEIARLGSVPPDQFSQIRSNAFTPSVPPAMPGRIDMELQPGTSNISTPIHAKGRE